MKKTTFVVAAISVTFGFAQANAAITTYTNSGDLLTDAPGANELFDFEAPAFPDVPTGISQAFNGTVNGVTFGPTLNDSADNQRMVGSFVDITVDFSGYADAVVGFGFTELDLTGTEITRVQVNLADDTSQTFDFGLAGAANLSPTFFGAITDTSAITSLVISGLRDNGNGVASPTVIDDLFVLSASEVPLPAAAWFMMAGFGGYAASRRNKKTS